MFLSNLNMILCYLDGLFLTQITILVVVQMMFLVRWVIWL